MTIQFAREEYSLDLVAQMIPLWKKHYDEIAQFKDIPLEPDLERYEMMAAKGYLRIYTARLGGALTGYQVFVINSHPHYKSSIQAVQDILFLDEPSRRGMTGYRFIKWCDVQLAREGIKIVYQHVKAAKDFGRVLERMGYRIHDLIYSRRLS